MDIHFVYADKCDQCLSMKQLLNALILYHGLKDQVNIVKYSCDSEEAIEVALEYEISEVPGCYIDGTVIEGEAYDREEVISAMEKLAETLKTT